MLSRNRSLLALAILIVGVSFSVAAAQETQVRCAGCKTEHYLIGHVADAFAQSSGLKLLPGGTGNKKAITLLSEGQIDFAYTCKPHAKLVKKFGIDPVVASGWVTTTIARDPIVVVVNKANGVTDLTTDQLTGLFSGRYTNWVELGGKDLPVTLAYLDPSVESGVVTVFKETTVGAGEQLSAAAKTLPSPGQLGNYTMSTPGAVTFMGLNSYSQEYGTVVSVDGVSPDRDRIVAGEYPLAVTYNIVHDKGKGGAAQELLTFLASPEGAALINQVMVAVPQKETALP